MKSMNADAMKNDGIMKQGEVSVGRFLRIVMLVMGFTVGYFVLDSISSVLLPFAIAWLLAYLIQPLVGFLQHRMRLKFRMLSILVAMLLIAAVIYGVIMLVLPSMLKELLALKDITASFLTQKLANTSIPQPVVDVFKGYAENSGFSSMLIGVNESNLHDFVLQKVQFFLLGTVDLLGALFTLCIILLYLFFFLLDFERLSESWQLYIPKQWRGVATKLWSDLVDGMNQYFRGQALVALCVGVLFSIGFLIIDFPAAIAFGMFIGILNLVPYLQTVSLVPMALLAMLKAANTGEDFWMIFLAALIVLAVVQIIQDLFLVPLIMGRRMNLHPAVILLSLSIFGHLLGLLGMIVALPVTTLILGYLKRYHEIAETSDYTEERTLKEAIDSATFGRSSAAEDDAHDSKK